MEVNEIYNESYEFLGVNNENQTIIALYSYKFPPRSDYSNFLKYLCEKVKNNVQNEYVLIYFNQRLDSGNPPTYLFLQNAYQQLSGDFKTKLKKLYVVNSTFMVKVYWIFNSIKSQEFYKKIVYVRNLEQLENELQVEISLKIPRVLFDFDKKINPIWYKRQFGASLQFINKNHDCNNYCPPILSKCVDYIFSYFENLETEGIFRTSGDFETTNKIRNRINAGEDVDFEAEGIALTVVTDLFNSLFRKLSEPLLTFSNYEEIVTFSDWPESEKLDKVKRIVTEKLPIENKTVFQFLVEFFLIVTKWQNSNKMNLRNSSICMAPNLIRSTNPNYEFSDIDKTKTIISFFEFVLLNHKEIYLSREK